MVLSAALPNLGEPGIVAFGAMLGTLIGGSIARMLGYTADNRMHWAVEGSYYGTGIAFVMYLAANLLEIALS
jgi:hypothetical protein